MFTDTASMEWNGNSDSEQEIKPCSHSVLDRDTHYRTNPFARYESTLFPSPWVK